VFDQVTTDGDRSIRCFFLRHVLRSWAVAAVACTVITVAVCQDVRSKRNDEFAKRQAQLVAAGLVPGTGGDLFDSVSRMRSRCDQLVAVGTLGLTGDLIHVYPNRKGHRQAVEQVVSELRPGFGGKEHEQETVSTSVASPDGTGTERIVAAVASLTGEEDIAAQRVVVLLREPDQISAGYVAVMLLGPLALVSVLAVASVYQWFASSVTSPLRRLAAALAEPPNADGRRRRLALGTCIELRHIAERYDELLRDYAATHMRHEEFQLNTYERLADREAGLDRKLRRAEDKALTDPITGLRNRGYLDKQLESLFEQHEGGEGDLSAVMFDLDFFKQHNDRYGHQAGDELLAFTGTLLSSATRAEDITVRYGGDEFLMLLPGVDPEQAARIADRMIKMFRQHARQFKQEPIVSMSAGVASLRRDVVESGHDLVNKADRALYKAKHGGKNAVAAFSAA